MPIVPHLGKIACEQILTRDEKVAVSAIEINIDLPRTGIELEQQHVALTDVVIGRRVLVEPRISSHTAAERITDVIERIPFFLGHLVVKTLLKSPASGGNGSHFLAEENPAAFLKRLAFLVIVAVGIFSEQAAAVLGRLGNVDDFPAIQPEYAIIGNVKLQQSLGREVRQRRHFGKIDLRKKDRRRAVFVLGIL